MRVVCAVNTTNWYLQSAVKKDIKICLQFLDMFI